MKKTGILKLLALSAVCALLAGCAAGAGGGVTTSSQSATTTVTTPAPTTTSTTETAVPTTTTTKQPTSTTKPQAKTADLMAGIAAGDVSNKAVDETFVKAQTKLALDLFKAAVKQDEDENVLISPLSAQLALAMVANGAAGKTLQEMETVLGGGITLPELNRYLHTYTAGLPSGDAYLVNIANSIWFRNGMNVKKDFLRTNANYYGAPAYQGAFDKQTVNDINQWVIEQTDGLIDSVVDGFSDTDMVYLVNTVLFNAEWKKQYGSSVETFFTTVGGESRMVDTLVGIEAMRYFEDSKAVGFAKEYKGGKYSFVALLPNEWITIDEYINNLTVDEIRRLLQSGEIVGVHTSVPQFDYEYDFDLENALKGLGMTSAFSLPEATFSALSDKDAYISEVVHKTKIVLDEKGTSAGALSAAKVTLKGAVSPKKRVVLDRPFAYMIVDNANMLPIFVGAVKEVEGEKVTVTTTAPPIEWVSLEKNKKLIAQVGVPKEWYRVDGWHTGGLADYSFCDKAEAGLTFFVDGIGENGADLPTLSVAVIPAADAAAFEKQWSGGTEPSKEPNGTFWEKDETRMLKIYASGGEYAIYIEYYMRGDITVGKTPEQIEAFQTFVTDFYETELVVRLK